MQAEVVDAVTQTVIDNVRLDDLVQDAIAVLEAGDGRLAELLRSDGRVAEALNTTKKPLNGSRIHLFGIAYKRDVNDMRESPALDVLELLLRRGAIVTYTDPWVPALNDGSHRLSSIDFDTALAAGHDCAVVTTDHTAFDRSKLAALPLVVDTRNALKGHAGANIVRL